MKWIKSRINLYFIWLYSSIPQSAMSPTTHVCMKEGWSYPNMKTNPGKKPNAIFIETRLGTDLDNVNCPKLVCTVSKSVRVGFGRENRHRFSRPKTCSERNFLIRISNMMLFICILIISTRRTQWWCLIHNLGKSKTSMADFRSFEARKCIFLIRTPNWVFHICFSTV